MFDVVYFSSVSENTKRFVDKLEAQSVRIPIRTEEAAEFVHDRDSVLVVPTYGGGNDNSTVPKQVIKFLNNPENRKHIKAVIAGGNTNFGSHFGKAGDIVADKLGVPVLYRFEITGTPEDVIEVKERLAQFWQIQS
ncbi:MAG: class Ib ribonucleoside-diphosphate reductase assembly flavoprotein NrdI [Actinobacteria bacterium]|jgi:protein involved in ribonucleotide reduction|nr:class Ib ribonucleoside-diphosphate reductase assembly flavoprotein NrdI [Aquiluna sp.]MDA0247126.1 class Ib ribonucleoside-diphosphate reductase assembly flavoprotein NrdI [Actinomycetota bacterium]NDD20357.1 class Ib ribonucleoside-diphosphate reductase assembly flavoprotein NrdI [Flavobacteriia bacterium]MDA2976686.1 class Ib ribonucleoside-diphosphate reductase assembly flavoprotein NrdI [Actinomycetota bacterium]NCV36766.1 class Ib ribonucleoside-diphosphate reductase assembly flavoprot